MPQAVPERVPPETKDWTWVLHQRCPQCSLEAGVLTVSEIPMVIRTQVQVWPVVLLRRNVAERPSPQVWSPLEYGAHTRDVLHLFQQRLHRMLTEEEPALADWDPNEAALQGGYHDADPDTVAAEILTEAEKLATAVEAVPADAAERRGLRSDGAAFSVTTLMQYLVHDLVHHLWDVTEGDTEDSATPQQAAVEPGGAGAQSTGAQSTGVPGAGVRAGGVQGTEVQGAGTQGASALAGGAAAEGLPIEDARAAAARRSATGSTGGSSGRSADGSTSWSAAAAAKSAESAESAESAGGADEASKGRGRDLQEASALESQDRGRPHETGRASGKSGDTAGQVVDAPEPPPIQAFANRHRRVLGISMTVIAVVLAVLDITVLPQPDTGQGVRAFVLRWAAPACWAMVAGVALTWALSVRRAVVNSFAYVAVACWLVYLGARMI